MRQRLLRLAFGLGLLASTTARVALGAGELEINQTCAELTGCFPGDAPGFPVTIDAPGTYRLTSNLDVPDAGTTALQATAVDANVTIDLGGFAIQGVVNCSGVPVSTCAPAGAGIGVFAQGAVRVRNGFVTGMGSHGVYLGFVGSVEDVIVRKNGGNGIGGGDGISVRGVTANSNGLRGISLGIESVVTHSSAIGNRQGGIVVTGGVVSENAVARNGARSSAQGAKRYYVTGGAAANGSQALGVCDAGYHMASLFEILDPTALAYDETRGFVTGDSGEGPPSSAIGWVRTGRGSSNAAIAGVGNCNGWTSANPSDQGTIVSLNSSWPAVPGIPGWIVLTRACDQTANVWCVSN